MNKHILSALLAASLWSAGISCLAIEADNVNSAETIAVQKAKDYLTAQPYQKDYLIDSYRVEEFDQFWNVYFWHINGRYMRPSECCIQINKETGEIKRRRLR